MSAGSAAVIAKARAKYGGLLGLDEYKTLISKANVGEIVAQLKHTAISVRIFQRLTIR